MFFWLVGLRVWRTGGGGLKILAGPWLVSFGVSGPGELADRRGHTQKSMFPEHGAWAAVGVSDVEAHTLKPQNPKPPNSMRTFSKEPQPSHLLRQEGLEAQVAPLPELRPL